MIDCCNIFPFDDTRCYVEVVKGQYIVRSLPDGTHVDVINCVLVNGELYNPHHLHRTGKVTVVLKNKLFIKPVTINCPKIVNFSQNQLDWNRHYFFMNHMLNFRHFDARFIWSLITFLRYTPFAVWIWVWLG